MGFGRKLTSTPVRFQASQGLYFFFMLCATLLVLVAPLCTVEIPPLLDYPNHLARYFVLAFHDHMPVLAQMFDMNWDFIPNLGMDLIIPQLMHFMPVALAGKIAISMALWVPLLGVILYHRSLYHRWSVWPLGFTLTSYNFLFSLGFLNFTISLGGALIVAAMWNAGHAKAPLRTMLVCSVGVVVIFFCHLLGMVFLAIVLGAQFATQVFHAWLKNQSLKKSNLTQQFCALSALATLMCFLFLISTQARLIHPKTIWPSLTDRIAVIFAPFFSYSILTAAIIGSIVYTTLYILYRTKHLCIPSHVSLALISTISAALILPFTLNNIAFVSFRFIIMASLLLFAGTDLINARPLLRYSLGGGVCLLVASQLGMVAVRWAQFQPDLVQLHRTVATIPPGARILQVLNRYDPDNTYWNGPAAHRVMQGGQQIDTHLAALVLLDRQAFWPTIFAYATTQPIQIRAPYRALAAPDGFIPNVDDLAMALTIDDATTTNEPNLREWRHNFDYVLLMDGGGRTDPATPYLPQWLKPVSVGDFASLYQVKKSTEIPLK